MEWEVGGGIGTGHTCKPMAVSFQCMTKFTTNKKKKKKKKKTLRPETEISLYIHAYLPEQRSYRRKLFCY